MLMHYRLRFPLTTSPTRLRSEQEKWKGRLNPDAVTALENGKRVFMTGYLVVLILAAGIVVFNLANLPALAAVSAAAGFAAWIFASARAFYLTSRMKKLVMAQYGLHGRLRPPLSFRVLSSTSDFDRWLLWQRKPRN